jgi:GMP synthase-like glutamine amidotransferase
MFKTTEPIEHPKQMTNVDSVLIIWGGDDISPSLYGQLPSDKTSAKTTLSPQDTVEFTLFQRAVELNIPIIGICRGAQLACALSGGTLIQHVDGHHKEHEVLCYGLDKKTTIMKASSIHHQMMYPFDTDCKILAVAHPKQSSVYYGEGNKELNVALEPEVVWFYGTNALAIQPHPEFMNPQSDFVQYCRMLIQKLLLPQPPNDVSGS